MRKIAGNIVSILANDIIDRAATFFLYALVARYMSAFEFGQLSLGLTLFQTFQLFAVAGLGVFITREIARDKAKAKPYFFNASLVVISFSIISIICLTIFTQAMDYVPETRLIIIFISFGLCPYALSIICDSVFKAWEKMGYIAYANLLGSIVKIGLAFLVLSQGYSLKYFVLLFFISYSIVLISKWWLLAQYIITPWAKINLKLCLTIIKSAITFSGIDGLLAFRASFTIILLSKFAGEVEVGLFSAASQAMIPIWLVINSTLVGVFPVMCRHFDMNFRGLKQIAELLLELLLIIVLPMVVGLYFLADQTLLLLYGNGEFSSAATALRIMVWVLIIRVFIKVFGNILIAGLLEKKTLQILTIDILASIAVGPILIIKFGLIGAAISELVVIIIDFIQHHLSVKKLVTQEINFIEFSWRPVLATSCMAIYLAIINDQNWIFLIISAGILYTTVLTVFTLWSLGGIQQVKNRYLYIPIK